MAIWISRYSNKELQSGKYYPVGISIGTPKFPLGYTLRKQCYSLAPKGYMLNMELERFKTAYYEKLEGIGTDRIIDMVQRMDEEARAEGSVALWQQGPILGSFAEEIPCRHAFICNQEQVSL